MQFEPSRDVDWFVLDDHPVLFQERHQRIIAVDRLASLVWQALWPDRDCIRPYSLDDAKARAAGKLADCGACSLARGSLFVEMCLEQWSAAHLIASAAEASTVHPHEPLGTSRHPETERIRREGARSYSFRLNGVTVAIEGDDNLIAAIKQIAGHLPHIVASHDGSEVLVRQHGRGFQANDARGQSAFLATPQEVVAWLKMAIIDATLVHRPGSIAVHAAALAGDGDVTMLVGGSGAGKSTLAACLSTQGFSLIGEDVVLIDPVSGMMSGLPFAFTAKKGSWSALGRYFPEIGNMPVQVRPDGKRVKPLRPRRTVGSIPISNLRSVVFPTYSAAGRTQIRDMERTTALVEILKEALSAGHVLTKSGFRVLCRALAGAAIFRLTYSDLETALRHIHAIRGLRVAGRARDVVAGSRERAQP